MHWSSFILSFLFGIFAFIFYVVFSQTDRRDKIYSSLFGWFLGTLIWMLLWRFTDMRMMMPAGFQ